MSELVYRSFDGRNRDQEFSVLDPAPQLDGIAAAQSLFKLRDREFCVAVAADDYAVIVAVPPLAGIAACAGVEEGKDLVPVLEHEIADVFSPVRIGIELRNRGFEVCRIDDDVRAALRGRGIDRLAGTGRELRQHKQEQQGNSGTGSCIPANHSKHVIT